MDQADQTTGQVIILNLAVEQVWFTYVNISRLISLNKNGTTVSSGN